MFKWCRHNEIKCVVLIIFSFIIIVLGLSFYFDRSVISVIFSFVAVFFGLLSLWVQKKRK